MKNKILIEGDDKGGAEYTVTGTSEFIVQATIALFESVAKIDPDGEMVVAIMAELLNIAETKYLKK